MSRDLIFEIGTEELPANAIEPALKSLETQWLSAAKQARLSHGEVQTHGSPRRLALLVREVASRAADHEEQVEGPALKVAFDAEGKPTRAAEGFARKVGLSVEQLQRKDSPQGERLFAVVKEEGQPALQLLPELLAGLIRGIPFRKSMRWGDRNETFARPVRWLTALLGGELVGVEFAGLKAEGNTYGHRFLSSGPIPLASVDDYLPRLREAKVLASISERRQRVQEEVAKVAKEAGARPVQDEALIDTITGLVEWPSAVLGTFDEDALNMPREVLVSEMRGHQKYVSLENEKGELLPLFVAVANTPVKDVAVSRRGYERVLKARLADARFFYDEDRQRSLASRVDDLRRVTFQQQLGSVYDKVKRIRSLAGHISESLERAQTPAELERRKGDVPAIYPESVDRAAFLCKADLSCGMVGEFPELQGVMGREYALHDGEGEDVSRAIFEHYLPKGASDALPTSDTGSIVGIADRLDTLAGIFAIGKAPTGAADPFALRRACIAVIRLLVSRGYRLSLEDLLDAALSKNLRAIAQQKEQDDASAQSKDQLEAKTEEGAKASEKGSESSSGKGSNKRGKNRAALPTHEEAKSALLDFFRGRLRSLYAEKYPVDVVEAVLAAGFDDLTAFDHRLKALAELVKHEDFQPLAIAFGRASNIVAKSAGALSGAANPELFEADVERELHQAVSEAASKVEALIQADDFPQALSTLAALRPAVDHFFDGVLVMAEDPAIRDNRLRLLKNVEQLFAPIADFAQIHVK